MDKELKKQQLENMFTDGVLKRFDTQRFLYLISDEISDAVDESLSWNFENTNSVFGKFMQTTTQSLGDIQTDVKVIRKDTKSLVESMTKLEKMLKYASLGGRGGGDGFFNLGDAAAGGSSIKKWGLRALSAIPAVFGVATAAYLIHKKNRKLDVATMAAGQAAQMGLGKLATSMADDVVNVGGTLYRNSTTIAFVRGLEKSAKYSKYAGILATVILNASEPYFAYVENKPPEIVRREIVGAIANVIGTIIGMKVGAVAGGAVGAWFAGAGAAPGVVIGTLLGGVVGYLSGEGLEAVAESVWYTIIEGNDIEQAIMKYADQQKKPKQQAKKGRLKPPKLETKYSMAGVIGSMIAPMFDDKKTTETTQKTGRLGKSTTAAVRIADTDHIPVEKEQPQIVVVQGNQPITDYYSQRVGGIDNGMGRYLSDQFSAGDGYSMTGRRRYRGGRAGQHVEYGGGQYGGGDGTIITPGLSEKDKVLWDALSGGQTVLQSSTLNRMTDEQLASLGITKSMVESPERRGWTGSSYTMGISDKELEDSLYSATAYKDAVLAGIASGEGVNDYGAINYKAGGGSTSDLGKHPFLGKKGYTAAGRYQILASNYAKYGAQIGVTDFSEKSQDAVAWQMASDVYKRQTGRSLDIDAKDPKNHSQIFKVLSSDWHGLRGASGLQKAMSWSEKEMTKGKFSKEDFTRLPAEQQAELKKQAMTKIFDSKKESFAQTAFAVNGAGDLGVTGGRVIERQRGMAAVRKGKLQPKLLSDSEKVAAKNNVRFIVTSGGQRMEGAPGAVGHTHNHDQGFAGDMIVETTDADGKTRILDANNPEDRKLLSDITRDYAQLGHSVGLGPNYMDGNHIHVGSGPNGTQRVWGDGESITGAPDWVKSAFYAGVDLKNKNVPFGDFSTTPKQPPMIATMPNQRQSLPTGPVIDAAYIDTQIKQATGELVTKISNLEKKSTETPTITKTGKVEADTSGPNPERFGGRQSSKPSSFHENNAKQKTPDWAWNPYISTIYSPVPPPD